MDISKLPDTASARLPATYEAARTQLAECTRVDECKEWADRSAALASYAKQADDDELEKMARRIRARAIRKVGELLREIEPATGAHRKSGGAPTFSRTDAARDAGISRDQQMQAVRVANVPETDFEQAVEGDDPPTVSALAEQGTRNKPKPLVDIGDRDPSEFALATRIDSAVRELAEKLEQADQEAVIRGLLPHEHEPLKENAAAADKWLRRLLERLEGDDAVQ